MIDNKKAVFLPIDNRILNLYKGYILNGEPLVGIKESDVYKVTEYYEYTGVISQRERIIKILVAIPLIPILFLVVLIAVIFKRSDQANYQVFQTLDRFFNMLFKKKKELITHKIKTKKHTKTVEEDIPEFLNHCKNNFATVYLYTYTELTSEEKVKVQNLIASDLISSCKTISKLSDLIPFIKVSRISLRNSLLIISDSKENNEATLLGFNSGKGFQRNVEFWEKSKFSSESGEGEIAWNSHKTIIGMKGKIEFYLRAKSNSFLTNDLILFIEDERDEVLNGYVQRNLSSINHRLEEKGMRLIHFPSLQNGGIRLHERILQFMRYRSPTLYSLSDYELNETIQAILNKLSPGEFYRIVLEELELPYFKRPCLLRNISGGNANTENQFTYKYIEYQTEEDLDKLFDVYIRQIKIPNDGVNVFYSLKKPPAKYDADWYFENDSKKDTEELKQKIDSIKAEGKYGVMVEAIMYMLATIKEEKPEIINKVRPLLEKKKLLESKVILSPIVIDKHYNIFLPDFGNIVVKMHALPKTVYIFFLRYPKGIRFKELYQHKIELLDIYNKVTNKYEKTEIEKAINDLVDMTNPSINQKCARIREAFRNIMDEHIAKHYYIDGLNGEPKKISLPQKLIDIRF